MAPIPAILLPNLNGLLSVRDLIVMSREANFRYDDPEEAHESNNASPRPQTPTFPLCADQAAKYRPVEERQSISASATLDKYQQIRQDDQQSPQQHEKHPLAPRPTMKRPMARFARPAGRKQKGSGRSEAWTSKRVHASVRRVDTRSEWIQAWCDSIASFGDEADCACSDRPAGLGGIANIEEASAPAATSHQPSVPFNVEKKGSSAPASQPTAKDALHAAAAATAHGLHGPRNVRPDSTGGGSRTSEDTLKAVTWTTTSATLLANTTTNTTTKATPSDLRRCPTCHRPQYAPRNPAFRFPQRLRLKLSGWVVRWNNNNNNHNAAAPPIIDRAVCKKENRNQTKTPPPPPPPRAKLSRSSRTQRLMGTIISRLLLPIKKRGHATAAAAAAKPVPPCVNSVASSDESDESGAHGGGVMASKVRALRQSQARLAGAQTLLERMNAGHTAATTNIRVDER